MNNTTKGEWINDGYADGCHYIYADKGDHVVSVAYAETSIHGRPFSKEEAEANAHLIALAGNLNQRIALYKLDSALAGLQTAWENDGRQKLELAVDEFLKAVIR